MEQDDLALAEEFVSRLESKIDPGIFEVTLFRSRARGDATEEFDLDLFVALKQEDPRKETEKLAFDITCGLTLDSGVLVSVLVADIRRFFVGTPASLSLKTSGKMGAL